jgi:hypothetical protein
VTVLGGMVCRRGRVLRSGRSVVPVCVMVHLGGVVVGRAILMDVLAHRAPEGERLRGREGEQGQKEDESSHL